MLRRAGMAIVLGLLAPLATAAEGTGNRGLGTDSVNRGELLFLSHCAVCHGKAAQGAPNWRQRGPDGKLPPPPLDATGHAWHHPRAMLARTIRDGTLGIGGGMPAWGGTLSDADIDSVIDWIVSRWPDPAYEAWRRGGHH